MRKPKGIGFEGFENLDLLQLNSMTKVFHITPETFLNRTVNFVVEAWLAVICKKTTTLKGETPCPSSSCCFPAPPLELCASLIKTGHGDICFERCINFLFCENNNQDTNYHFPTAAFSYPRFQKCKFRMANIITVLHFGKSAQGMWKSIQCIGLPKCRWDVRSGH